MSSKPKSFQDLKVGDDVLISRPIYLTSGGWRSGVQRDALVPAKVEKVTTTQFTADGIRFQRRNGSQFGGDAARAYLPGVDGVVATPEHVINGWLLLRGALGDLSTRLMKLERESSKLIKTLAQAKPEEVEAVLKRIAAFSQALTDLKQDGSI